MLTVGIYFLHLENITLISIINIDLSIILFDFTGTNRSTMEYSTMENFVRLITGFHSPYKAIQLSRCLDVVFLYNG